jgi:ketosteroid isomerase-like protein
MVLTLRDGRVTRFREFSDTQQVVRGHAGPPVAV